jgi:hypothetical protein
LKQAGGATLSVAAAALLPSASYGNGSGSAVYEVFGTPAFGTLNPPDGALILPINYTVRVHIYTAVLTTPFSGVGNPVTVQIKAYASILGGAQWGELSGALTGYLSDSSAPWLDVYVDPGEGPEGDIFPRTIKIPGTDGEFGLELDHGIAGKRLLTPSISQLQAF